MIKAELTVSFLALLIVGACRYENHFISSALSTEDGLTSSLLAAASIGYAPPFPIAMNGGYPTHRAPYPSLPGVADVKILAPKYTRKWEREQAKKQGGSSSWGLAIVVAGAAAGWYALGGREGVEKVAREVVAKVGEIVASFK